VNPGERLLPQHWIDPLNEKATSTKFLGFEVFPYLRAKGNRLIDSLL
jgi:hypothetical protein